MGQLYPSPAIGQIPSVDPSHPLQMAAQRIRHATGQQGATVLAALPVVHREFLPAEVQVMHPQPQRFHQPQAAAVEQARHQRLGSFQPLQHRPHLLSGWRSPWKRRNLLSHCS
jgi:hypothetical protein